MKTIKKYNQPGEYEELIQLGPPKADQPLRAEDWVGVMRATPTAMPTHSDSEAGGQLGGQAKEGREYKLNIVVEHKESETKSRVVVRAIVRNGAKVILSGMIKIPKGVRGVDSQLELRVLLLDEESSASVNPQLEIESDEVRAGHSASVSRIDDGQVQYLMSRGISREQVEEEIIEGWLMGEW